MSSALNLPGQMKGQAPTAWPIVACNNQSLSAICIRASEPDEWEFCVVARIYVAYGLSDPNDLMIY